MKVENILLSKGDAVHAVAEQATVRTAVDLLGAHNIGAVLVTDAKGALSGILSERDIVRRLRTDGPSVLATPVANCMTPQPFTCGLQTTLDELLGEMTRKRIRHMPVVEGGALVGVVSIGDVVKRKIEVSEAEAAALKEYIAS
ncbi:MAG: CBS domain-containing protein [Pseudomonadota bacterium]